MSNHTSSHSLNHYPHRYLRYLFIITLLLTFALSALPLFADTSLVASIQYTQDKSSEASLVTYDTSADGYTDPVFARGSAVYLTITLSEDASADAVTVIQRTKAVSAADVENEAAGSSSSSSQSSAASGASSSAASSGTVDGASGTGAESEVLEPDEDGFYRINTDTAGTYEILVTDRTGTADASSSGMNTDDDAVTGGTGTGSTDSANAVMTFVVAEDSSGNANNSSGSGESTGVLTGWQTIDGKKYYYDSTGKVTTGIFKVDSAYYYSDGNGVVRQTAGFVRSGGKLYYVQSGGTIRAGASFQISGKTYCAASNGVIQTGVYKWGKYYYYANSSGALQTSKGFVSSGGKRYYVQKGGRIITGKSFKIRKKTYRAASNGVIQTGVYKWGKYYYYANSSGALRTKKGFVSSGGKRYYVQKGGKLRTSKTFRIKGKQYRACKDGHLATGVFKLGKYYRYANSKGQIRTKKGFVTSGGKRYYVQKGGKIRAGKSFKIGKYTYRSASNGVILTGVYKWGSAYYYASSSGRLRTSAGQIRWNGKTYYVRSGGKLYRNKFYFCNANMYYASSNAAAKTGTFQVGGYTYVANSTGVITSSNRKYMKGIDVSYWQGDISAANWKKVQASGISFAFIRCGYTGSSNGKQYSDSKFKQNIQRATAAGIDVGVYYFTQATTTAEAVKEAQFAVQQIQASGCSVTLPVVIDTENVSGGRAASGKLSKAKRTAVIKAFCAEIKKEGYTPMIYASTSWLNNQLDMSKLSGYKVWVAQYNTEVTYKGSYQCWQYSSKGKVPGISGNVDLDYWAL